MITVVVAGLQKEVTERAIKKAGGEHVSVIVTTDMDAAKKVKNGEADYYLGACNTGGGAALSVAIAILGYGKCSTIAKNGGKPDDKTIEKLVSEGKLAFGMAVESIEAGSAMVVHHLLKKHGLV